MILLVFVNVQDSAAAADGQDSDLEAEPSAAAGVSEAVSYFLFLSCFCRFSVVVEMAGVGLRVLCDFKCRRRCCEVEALYFHNYRV